MSAGDKGDARSELTDALRILDQAGKSATPAAAAKKSHRKRVAFSSEKEELSKSAIKLRDMTQTSRLRKQLAVFAIVAVSAQLVVANGYFGFYLWKTQDAGFEPSVMIAWLTATVVEVVGIVVIVARNLFPATATSLRRRDVKRLARAVKQAG